jgi:hypothetical protein
MVPRFPVRVFSQQDQRLGEQRAGAAKVAEQELARPDCYKAFCKNAFIADEGFFQTPAEGPLKWRVSRLIWFSLLSQAGDWP